MRHDHGAGRGRLRGQLAERIDEGHRLRKGLGREGRDFPEGILERRGFRV
jgi:hypothetical protein